MKKDNPLELLPKVNGEYQCEHVKEKVIRSNCIWCNLTIMEKILAKREDNAEKCQELETVLEAWYKVFGTTQLTHASDRLEAAEKKVKKLEEYYKPKLEVCGISVKDNSRTYGCPHCGRAIRKTDEPFELLELLEEHRQQYADKCLEVIALKKELESPLEPIDEKEATGVSKYMKGKSKGKTATEAHFGVSKKLEMLDREALKKFFKENCGTCAEESGWCIEVMVNSFMKQFGSPARGKDI